MITSETEARYEALRPGGDAGRGFKSSESSPALACFEVAEAEVDGTRIVTLTDTKDRRASDDPTRKFIPMTSEVFDQLVKTLNTLRYNQTASLKGGDEESGHVTVSREPGVGGERWVVSHTFFPHEPEFTGTELTFDELEVKAFLEGARAGEFTEAAMNRKHGEARGAPYAAGSLALTGAGVTS